MDSSSIDIPGSEIASIVFQDTSLHISFSRAYIIKTMTGSVERTRWWQAGELIFSAATIHDPIPNGPLVCAGGDITENLYTYRDMLPIPFTGRGQIECLLKFKNCTEILHLNAQAVRLQLEAVPKYIEHIRPQTAL